MEEDPAVKQPSSPSLRHKIRLFLRQFCRSSPGLNVFFATLCVIDLFGVFPIVALPGALISCGKQSISRNIFQIFSFDLDLFW